MAWLNQYLRYKGEIITILFFVENSKSQKITLAGFYREGHVY